jgi:leader peptidase (prepilin peptidase)/N-methyltransferase
MCLSALALNGVGWSLLAVDSARRELKQGPKPYVFGVIMAALCMGIAASLPLLYADNSFLFNIKRICLLSILCPVAYADYTTLRIPNLLILAGVLFRVIIFAFELFFESAGIWTRVGSELIASAALTAAALLCGLLVKNSIGFGDIKLFIVMGIMLGLDGIWSAVFVSLIISFAVSVVLMISKKKKRGDTIPFAPAIMIGTYISVFLTGR